MKKNGQLTSSFQIACGCGKAAKNVDASSSCPPLRALPVIPVGSS